jgi:hypothetical protein
MGMVAWVALWGGAGVAKGEEERLEEHGERTRADEDYVRKRVRSLSSCYEMFDPSSDKGLIRIEIQPDGDVSHVSVEARSTSGLERCLTQRMRGWKFPAIGAEPRRLTYSLVFVAARQ